MILNPIQLVLDANGNLIDKNYNTIRSHDNYKHLIQVVSPALITEAVDVTVSAYNEQLIQETMRLRIARDANDVALKGSDVIDPSETYYATASDWNVWEAEVIGKTVSVLQRINAHKVGLTVQFSTKIPNPNLTTSLGTFGSATSTTGGDLPTISTELLGEYYTCDLLSYTSAETGETYAYGDVAYSDTTQWVSANEFTVSLTAPIVYVSVDPSLALEYEGVDLDQTTQIVTDLATMDGIITGMQSALADKADLSGGVIQLDQLPAGLYNPDTDTLPEGVTNLYYTETRVSNNSSVASNTAHRNNLTNPHAVTKEQLGLGNVDNTSDADKPISTATQAYIDGAVAGLVDTAPAALDTLNELAAALGDDPNFATTISTQIGDINTELLKLDTIESGATQDQTPSEIKIAYESNSDTNAFTNTEKTKLSNISVTGAIDLDTATLQGNTFNTGNKLVKLNADGSLPAIDGSNLTGLTVAPVLSVNSLTGDVVLDKTHIGLTNVENTADADKPISTATQAALDLKADLVGGKIPQAQLPGYVDDVLEYIDEASFPAVGESDKIYISLTTNDIYRWSGTIYVQIGGGILDALGVKTLYESNSDTNVFTDAEKTKLSGIEDGAEVNDPNTTLEGNTFNGASQLVKLDINGRLPSLDGRNLTNVSTVADLDDLTDVAIVSPVTGHVILHNGTNFVNAELPSDSLSDFNTSGAVDGEILKFDGTNWSRWVPDYISSYTETDPIYSAWDKSTGISITESQISDLKTYLTAASSLDATKLTGTISSSNLPPLAITSVHTAVDETEHLSITAQEGDVVIRTDESVSYIHNGGSAGTMADYTQLSTPTNLITSVNGQQGVVSLDTDDISEGVTNKYYATSLFNADLATKTTDNIAEGTTNLYQDANATNQGNTFNGPNQLVQVTPSGQLPALDGSLLTGISVDEVSVVENISMPTSNWTQVGDFWESTISTANAVKDGSICEVYPVVTTDGIRKAWIAQGVVGVQRVSDYVIKVISNYPNSQAYNLKLIIGSDAPSEQASSQIDDLTNVVINTPVDDQFLRYDGTKWINETVTLTSPVLSVNTQTGAVVLDTDDISEGTNLYYTSLRFDTDFASKSTTDLDEGTNLYYTEARVNANANVTANSAHRVLTNNPHSVTALQLGLDSYTAYTPATLPISTATQSALDLKADTTYVNNEIANLIDTAPTTLDTLNELAAALGDDPNFATTMTNSLANKVDKVTNYGLSKNDFTDALKSKLEGLTQGEVNTVDSVNGETGVVVLNTDHIAEGATNEYYTEAKVSANADVVANTAKVGITPQQASDITTNNAKVGITVAQANNIASNTLKVGYSDVLVSSNADVVANSAKISFDTVSSTKLAGIEEGAQVNDANTTLQGNTFNGNSELVQTTADGKLPALDGSNLTGLSSGVTTLSGMTDTSIVTPADNEFLRYDGSNWINEAVSLQNLGDTDDLSEGTTNLYYTEARVSANSSVAANTAKISYTDAAAVAANTAKISYSAAAQAEVAANTAKISYTDAADVALNTTHRSSTSNPHSVDKSDVGLGNVDNTADSSKYVQGVVETRNSDNLKFWSGTQAQYDAIGTKDANTIYFIE